MGEEKKYINVGCDPSWDPTKDSVFNNADKDLQSEYSGLAGATSREVIPEFRKTPSEKVISNKRNAWIVIGVDRENTATSGYGGRGHNQCAAIDLVAGRMGPYVRDRDDVGNPVKAIPDFKIDAARVYISQKADIDKYFDLPRGKVGSQEAVSAVAVKADEVRFLARGGIKLVTGVDTRDSRNCPIIETKGIDLIAGNTDKDLQPIVKGDNLVEAFAGLVSEIEKLREIVYSFLKYQGNYNRALLTHTHVSPFFGIPTSPSFEKMPEGVKTILQQLSQTEASIVSHATSLSSWETSYLEAASAAYINSTNNNTN